MTIPFSVELCFGVERSWRGKRVHEWYSRESRQSQHGLCTALSFYGSNETNFSSIVLYPRKERAEKGEKGAGGGDRRVYFALSAPQNTYNYIDDIFIHTYCRMWSDSRLLILVKPSSLLCYSRMCFTDNHVIRLRLSGFIIVEVKRGNKAIRQLDRYKVLISFSRF